MDPSVFLSTCVTIICSAHAGTAVIANPDASNSAAPKVFDMSSLQMDNGPERKCTSRTCKEAIWHRHPRSDAIKTNKSSDTVHPELVMNRRSEPRYPHASPV